MLFKRITGTGRSLEPLTIAVSLMGVSLHCSGWRREGEQRQLFWRILLWRQAERWGNSWRGMCGKEQWYYFTCYRWWITEHVSLLMGCFGRQSLRCTGVWWVRTNSSRSGAGWRRVCLCTRAVSVGNRREGRDQWQRSEWAAIFVWGRQWNPFPMAFVFPKKPEAKSLVMREGRGRGYWTLEEQEKRVKSSFWKVGV